MDLLVGVIVPVFNRQQKLLRAVRSVLMSENIELQLLVVDDASIDDLAPVERIVRKEGHQWLRLDTNSGPAEARNRGIAQIESKVDWFCFLDSDDYWLPGKLAEQIAWHASHPEFRISQVEEQWCRNGEIVKKPRHWQQKGGDLFEASVERCSIGPSCVMIRRDLWMESGGFDPRFRVCEDYELWLRITASEKVGLIPGGPFVCKEGGHSDQLSVIVPAMDRYRINALLKLLEEGNLNFSQAELVREGIRTKSDILAKGAEKRGNTGSSAFYSALSRELDLDPYSWIPGAWEQCGD